MKDIDIIKEYEKEIYNLFTNITMIIYGSTAYGVNTSDLDVCFISDKILSKEEYEKLESITREFHYKNNLRIDEEIPYTNKLVYTNSFIENTLLNLPFPYVDGKYIIPPIQKNKKFLSSLDMSKRLLLNILTVKHIIINGNEEKIDKYEMMAWEQILKTVISYSEKNEFSFHELMNCLYMDPFSQEGGEMYLGYKTNLKEKKIYLEETVKKQLNNLENNKKLIKTLNSKYIPQESWIKK